MIRENDNVHITDEHHEYYRRLGIVCSVISEKNLAEVMLYGKDFELDETVYIPVDSLESFEFVDKNTN